MTNVGGGKKALKRRVRALRKQYPTKVVELWTEDETRLGLKPITRRVWALKGERPIANGQARYQWLYVYGFAEPKTGKLFRVFLPRVKTRLMSQALLQFAARADPYRKKLLVLVVDNAGWHVSKKLEIPKNVVLHRLPPCTPELQPIETLWPLVREAVANRRFHDVGHLKNVVRRRCDYLAQNPDLVRSRIAFDRVQNI
jgi:DDE superfamily endonuclease